MISEARPAQPASTDALLPREAFVSLLIASVRSDGSVSPHEANQIEHIVPRRPRNVQEHSSQRWRRRDRKEAIRERPQSLVTRSDAVDRGRVGGRTTQRHSGGNASHARNPRSLKG